MTSPVLERGCCYLGGGWGVQGSEPPERVSKHCSSPWEVANPRGNGTEVTVQRALSSPKASMTGLEFKIRCSILSAILWLSQDVGEAATTA